MTNPQIQPHVKIGDHWFRIDEDADSPFKRVSDSLMQARTDISGVPGAINLSRDLWLWQMTDFAGGEGREVFDSSDPLGPPTFWKTDGGVDTRVRGEFSLHPDEQFLPNDTGGSAPGRTSWTNLDFTTVTGSPTYSAGHASAHVRLAASDKIRSPARTPGAIPVRVYCRFVQAKTVTSNKQVSVKFEIWNATDSTSTASGTKTVKENEPTTIILSATLTAGKTYHYRASNEDSGTVTVDVKSIKEETFAATLTPQDVRDMRLGIGDNIWALNWDGTNTDVLRWNFTNDTWDQIDADMVASIPRCLTGSDQYMYSIHADKTIWRINASGGTAYANAPSTAVGAALSVCVANNKLYALYDQGLFELTLDSTSAGLPFDEAEVDYTLVVAPGEFPKEASPDTNLRQHMCATTNGVRFFVNVRGSQTVIYEFSGGALTPTHFLPKGYIATAIYHYANITFIAATFTNSASSPAESRVGTYYIGSDGLLRFIGIPRFTETNSQNVSFIDSYAHDLYFFQGRRIWRYNLGAGGITLENVTSQNDESKSRALARMDKKFWAAVEGEGVFVADDTYPTTTMYLYSPVWDFDVPDLQKVLVSIDVVTAPLPANTIVAVEYRADEASSWTAAGTIDTDGAVKSRISISSTSSTIKFTTLQWRIGLTSTDGVDTPRVRSVTARALVLDYEDYFDLVLKMDDDTSSDRLRSEQLTGRQKAARLWAYKTSKNIVAFEDHYSSDRFSDSDSYSVVVEDPFQDFSSLGQSALRLRLKVIS